jgi:hypothetical protein
MGTEIFVETSGGKHEQKAFASGSCRLALRTKQQRRSKGFKLFGRVLRRRGTTTTHPWFGSWTHWKWWHWHKQILTKGHGSVKISARH